MSNLQSGRRAVGASTITQQVAKNFLLSSDQTMERKLKEAILSIRIERAFTKEQILELYLNEIYLGAGAYGVAAAAQTYWDKALNELTLGDCAYLATLPKAPSNYEPFKTIDIKGDWGKTLGSMPVWNDIDPWRLAVVLDVSKDKATIGLRPGRTPQGVLVKDRDTGGKIGR